LKNLKNLKNQKKRQDWKKLETFCGYNL
jgi:hypothetical protein